MRKYIYPILVLAVAALFVWWNGRLDDQEMNGNLEKDVVTGTDDATSDDGDGSDDTGVFTLSRKRILPASTGEIVHHKTYSLSYQEAYEQSEWVAYILEESDLKKVKYKRPYFIQDPYVSTQSAQYWNWKNSGYDRGHLVPAGDRKASKAEYDETFFTSNISPQESAFNQGIWNTLENKVRYWAGRYDRVAVVTGPILSRGTRTIGDERVSVSDSFYKIVLRQDGEDYYAIAFLIPHERSTESLYNYIVSIDELEKKTGIDFFPQLNDSLEDRLESNRSDKGWARLR